ncbi:MAG: hypothetical protein M1823_006873 [Watsoniomyces obsoletus]|nr:MAG: hypothetical protein M1823_006873 [Watsoniomyces obsoletus]
MAVPLILCGKIEGNIKSMCASLAPEYDIIHVVRTTDDAKSELPALLKGDSVKPSSGFGSNTDASSPTSGTEVKAVIVGGGYSPDEFEAIKSAVDGTKPLPFIRADTSKPRPAGAPPGPPPPSEIRERLMKALEEAKGKGWEAGLYLF